MHKAVGAFSEKGPGNVPAGVQEELDGADKSKLEDASSSDVAVLMALMKNEKERLDDNTAAGTVNWVCDVEPMDDPSR
jgi:hypothetical protein